jgi:hypothetical protein
MKCYQCANPALWQMEVGKHKIPLCLHCYHKYAQIQQQEIENHERMMNHLVDEMAFISGVPSMGPRFPPRPQPLRVENVTLQNFNIRDSAIGVLNAGTIGSIDAAVTAIKSTGAVQIGEAVTKLTEGVAASPNLDAEQKNDALEILSALAVEAATPENDRKLAVVKTLLTSFGSLVSVAADLTTLWATWSPAIRTYFGV